MADPQTAQSFLPHPLAYFFYYLLGVLMALSAFWMSYWNAPLGAFVLAVAETMRRSERFTIGDEAVESEFRFISTRRTSIEYIKIQDVKVSQNPMDRIFGIGTVAINSAGSPMVEVEFRGVMGPYEIERAIREKMAGSRMVR